MQGRALLLAESKYFNSAIENATGAVVRYKARWVCRGFEAVYGQDYTKTTSPTARMESFWVLLHLGAALDYDIQQIGVKTAFLNGVLPPGETCFMEQPPGFFLGEWSTVQIAIRFPLFLTFSRSPWFSHQILCFSILASSPVFPMQILLFF